MTSDWLTPCGISFPSLTPLDCEACVGTVVGTLCDELRSWPRISGHDRVLPQLLGRKGICLFFSFVINSAFDMLLFVLLLDCQFGMSPPRFLGWGLGSDWKRSLRTFSTVFTLNMKKIVPMIDCSPSITRFVT